MTFENYSPRLKKKVEVGNDIILLFFKELLMITTEKKMIDAK